MAAVRKDASRIPLYIRIESLIRSKVLTGQLEPGDKLPKEDDMITEFGVSRITIRNAMANLEREGLIVRNPAIGTYVSDNIPVSKKYVITNDLRSIINDANRYKVKVIDLNVTRLGDTRNPRDVRKFLDLTNDDLIYTIRRLRFLKGQPVCLIENFLPIEVGKYLSKSELARETLLKIIKDKTGRVLDRGEMYIEAVPADPDTAKLLETQLFQPLIMRQIYYWFPDNEPCEMVMYFMRPDHFKYKAEIVGVSDY